MEDQAFSSSPPGEITLSGISPSSTSAAAASVVYVGIKNLPLQAEDEEDTDWRGRSFVSASLASSDGRLLPSSTKQQQQVRVRLLRPQWQAQDHFARCLSLDGSSSSSSNCATVESNSTHTECACADLAGYTTASSSPNQVGNVVRKKNFVFRGPTTRYISTNA